MFLKFFANNTLVSRNFICSNKESGVFITKEFVYVYWNSDYVTISENNISFNEKWGVHIDGNYHRVFANNFIKNRNNAFFIKWSDNYWEGFGSSNFKLISGRILLYSGRFKDYFFPWFQFDLHLAKEPYDI